MHAAGVEAGLDPRRSAEVLPPREPGLAEHDVVTLVGYLFQQARRLTKQHADAEDLVQETLVKSISSYHSFGTGSNLKAWSYRIMVNLWIDAHRARQRRPAELLTGEMSDAQLAGGAGRSEASAELHALASMPSEADAAMRALPADLRVTIYYADMQGRPNTEVAKMLNVPVGTVGSRLHRGRGLLRDALGEHYLRPQERFSA